MKPAWSRGAVVLLLLVPGGLSDPVKGEACISPDLDGSRFSLPDGLLHGLHQVLGIVDQHLSSLLEKKHRDATDWNDTFYWTFKGKWLSCDLTQLTCSDSSSLMLVRPNMVALTVDRILSWVLMVGIRSHTWKWGHVTSNIWNMSNIVQSFHCFLFFSADLEQVGPDALVSTLLGHFLGQPCNFIGSLGDVLGTLDEGTLVPAASAHQTWHLSHEQRHSFGSTNDVISLRGNNRSMMNLKVQDFKGPLLFFRCSLTLLDHLRASSWSCLAATIMGSLTISPAFCSGNSSSFSSGGGGLGGGTSPSGRGGLGGAASSLSYKEKFHLMVIRQLFWRSSFRWLLKFKVMLL